MPDSQISGIPPGCGPGVGDLSGGVAALNHRLIYVTPAGVGAPIEERVSPALNW